MLSLPLPKFLLGEWADHGPLKKHSDEQVLVHRNSMPTLRALLLPLAFVVTLREPILEVLR